MSSGYDEQNKPPDIEFQNDQGVWTVKRPEKKIPYLNIILFILTFITTTAAGAGFAAKAPSTLTELLLGGLTFSIPLMTILLCHETGHYVLSRIHGVEATLPYFIPAPTAFGTFGAIIKMKSVIRSKNVLLDIGAAGPLAGFFVSLPFLIYGITHSTIIPADTVHEGFRLGDSLMMKGLTYFIWGSMPEGKDLLLHPVAFAGWIGNFVTAMNLIPAGQLDGGHIVYALFPRRFKTIARLCVVTLLILGFYLWPGWIIWAVLLVFLSPSHPPIANPDEPLHPFRRFLGFTALFVFIISFIPAPFQG